jgi:uncharacterized protein YdaL
MGVAARLRAVFALAFLALAACGGGAQDAVAPPPPPPPPLEPARARTLVLHDETGPWGWLGEVYAIQVGHLASHFGSWSAKPVSSYAPGDLDGRDLVVYVGSTWNEPLPRAFMDDLLAGATPVVWIAQNVEQLAPPGDLAARYGFAPVLLDHSPVAEVRYKGRPLTRDASNREGIRGCAVADGGPARVLAEAVRGDGTALPWAIRAGNLTYVAENPFAYVSEADRYLAFADLLFDALAPATPERHRALVRLEDVSPVTPPEELRALTRRLAALRVPFSIALVPVYVDPLGVYSGDGLPEEVRLADVPALVDVLEEALANGGVLVQHGTTHQLGAVANPYDGTSTADFEFWTASVEPGGRVAYGGPVPGDSAERTLGIVARGRAEVADAGLPLPVVFEYPHYAGSAVDSLAIAGVIPTAYHRGFYFSGLLRGPVDDARFFGQLFPYEVTDVYGWRVVPENLGNYQPSPDPGAPARTAQDLVENARANLVVRDGFASFFFHPFFDAAVLEEIVTGVRGAGYEFVSPLELEFAEARRVQ